MTAKWILPGVLAALVAGACSSSDPDGGEPTGTGAGLRLEEVARLESPVGMATREGDPALYVIEQPGRVRALRDGQLDPRPVLDIGGDVSPGGERGLLGIAFAPDGRHLYLDYTNDSGDTRVAEWSVAADGTVDPDSRRELLAQDQPFANHNGGQLAFGPDGFLYIGLGDGGSGGDPKNNGQDLGTWLGKVLRIDPRPDGGRAYRVPADNPFVDQDGARPEIWAYGLRNPWRFAFDSETGDLWIGDAGQNAWEEVDRQPGDSEGGENYGWNLREGRHDFRRGDVPDDVVEPVLEYRNGQDGCAVIGGTVYRGSQIPDLSGQYLYGDFCDGWINAVPVTGDEVGTPREVLRDVPQLTSFGVDQSGEIYVLSIGGTVYRLTSG